MNVTKARTGRIVGAAPSEGEVLQRQPRIERMNNAKTRADLKQSTLHLNFTGELIADSGAADCTLAEAGI